MTILAAFLWIITWSTVAYGSADTPSIDVYATQTNQPIIVGSSPQIELAAYLLTLATDEAPRVGTPAWAHAYADTTQARNIPAVRLLRDLIAQGLPPATIYRFALLHTDPPEMTSRLRSLGRSVVTDDLKPILKRKSDAKTLLEGMRHAYDSGGIAQILHRYAKARGSMVRACQNALPGPAPLPELQEWTGMPPGNGTTYLVPSLLAQQPARFSVLLPDGNTAHISVLPMDEDGIPDQDAATLIRYEEATYWFLSPLFEQFHLELQEITRFRQDAEAQLAQAAVLYLLDRHRPTLLEAAHITFGGPSARLVPVFENGFKQWEAVKPRFPTLPVYLPELLDRAILSLEGSVELPRLKDPGFESWDGVVPREWSIEVIEPATEAPRPSSVDRVRGTRRDSSALRLAADADTNQWLGVVSRPVPVSAGDRITLQARMRARNVTPRGGRIRAAHLEIRVLSRDGALLRRIVGRDFLGTTGWERVNLEFIVPAAAETLRVACVLTMIGELSFDDIVMSIERSSLRRFIRNGGFEIGDEDGPTDWQVDVVAIQTQSGPSVRSLWSLDTDDPYEGTQCLRLEGNDTTGRWLEVRSTPLSVAPGQKVTVTGKMRSRNVTLGPRQHRHANLVLTFLNEKGLEVSSIESSLLEGTVETWVPVELEAIVPMDAVAVRIGCLLTMTGQLWFDDIHVSRR